MFLVFLSTCGPLQLAVVPSVTGLFLQTTFYGMPASADETSREREWQSPSIVRAGKNP